jgi:hypothetical protein
LNALDQWLQRLHAKHPLRFLFLSVGLAGLVLAAAMLLKFFVECLPKGVGQP